MGFNKSPPNFMRNVVFKQKLVERPTKSDKRLQKPTYFFS
jgi:hypothetical protein